MANVILAIHTCDETKAIYRPDEGLVYPDDSETNKSIPAMTPQAIVMALQTLDPEDLYDVKKELGVEVLRTEAVKIATTALADLIRLRLIEHTPVKTSYEALIFAYTLKQFAALEEIGQASDFQDIVKNIKEAMLTAQQHGFEVPRLT